MTTDRVLPPDPLAFIRECVLEGRVLWTYHVTMRMERRSIPRDAVVGASASYEIIEAYPEDKYLPSYLIRAENAAGVFHVLFAADVPGANVRVVTAYKPDPIEWDSDFKRRKKP